MQQINEFGKLEIVVKISIGIALWIKSSMTVQPNMLITVLSVFFNIQLTLGFYLTTYHVIFQNQYHIQISNLTKFTYT